MLDIGNLLELVREAPKFLIYFSLTISCYSTGIGQTSLHNVQDTSMFLFEIGTEGEHDEVQDLVFSEHSHCKFK